MPSLDLGVIGNCAIAALIDRTAGVVWCCFPRFDGDPVFHALLDGSEQLHSSDPTAGRGFWRIELEGAVRSEQNYVPNTAVLSTRLFDDQGGAIEITDFAPRFTAYGRQFHPLQLVRRVRPLAGFPRIRIRLRPSFDYGASRPTITFGSNHASYSSVQASLRLTTDAPVTYVLSEAAFLLDEPLSFMFGPDETLREGVASVARLFQEQTEHYWREWTRRLALPLEWQEALIRSAITLKLCTYEDTGAIVAALTTSIPEAPGTQRNWDYRYCWLRDAFFVVRALNRLSEVETLEHYLRYLGNLVVSPREPGHLQPVYGIGLESRLDEREAPRLAGYRGMGPVRVGNQAYEHFQHDVYGNVVLAYTQAFFDQRLIRRAGDVEFEWLERVGERAYEVYGTPDAGMWELRTRSRVHTSSALMCWAACDRLAKIATQLGHPERAGLWSERAREIQAAILSRAWNARIGSLAECFEGGELEGGLLLIGEVGFLPPEDPRFIGTVEAIGRQLRRGDFLMRYRHADDFGEPGTAFNICTFWYIDALQRIGRREEARELFSRVLDRRNHLGLLSEDTDPASGELWGNFPQTYSMVGIINAVTSLSRSWSEVV